MTLRQQIDLYLSAASISVETSTLESYSYKLEQFCIWVEARRAEVATPLFFTYRDSLIEHGLNRNSVAAHMKILRSFYAWLADNGHIQKSPVPKLRGEVAGLRKQGINEEDYEKLLALVKKRQDPNWEYAIRVGWATGLRLGDVAMLKRQYVNLDDQTISLEPIKTMNTRPARVEIPISDELCNFLRPLMQGDQRESMCPAFAKQYMADGHKTLSARFCDLCRMIGSPKSFHRFRDAFITRLIINNVSPALVAEMTGITLNRLMTYVNTPLAVKRKAINTIIKLKQESAAA